MQKLPNKKSVSLFRLSFVRLSALANVSRLPLTERTEAAGLALALPFGRLWYDGPNAISNAIGYATHRRRSHDAVIRVYDESGNVIETHERMGDFEEW